jgi:hypothetical protein
MPQGVAQQRHRHSPQRTRQQLLRCTLHGPRPNPLGCRPAPQPLAGTAGYARPSCLCAHSVSRCLIERTCSYTSRRARCRRCCPRARSSWPPPRGARCPQQRSRRCQKTMQASKPNVSDPVHATRKQAVHAADTCTKGTPQRAPDTRLPGHLSALLAAEAFASRGANACGNAPS